jgi:hypothetical protein
MAQERQAVLVALMQLYGAGLISELTYERLSRPYRIAALEAELDMELSRG